MVVVDTLTTVNHLHGDAGDTISLVAHVNKESDNTPVYEGTLTFTVATTLIDTVNIVNGVATKTWTIPAGWTANDYTITALFVGTVNYNTSTGTNTLTIDPATPQPKPGVDTAWAKDRIVDYLYTLNHDKDEITDPDVPILPTGRILTGEAGKVSLRNGLLGSFGIGDTTEIEEGLRGQPAWHSHKAELMLVVPGETPEAKDKLEEARRIIQLNINKNQSLGIEDIAVFIPDTNSVKRFKVSFEDPSKNINAKWNSAMILFFTVKIAEVPET